MHAQEVFQALRDAGVRVQIDLRNEKLGFKIREAQVEKIPYMLVVGDKEMDDGTVAPRHRSGANLESMTPVAFANFVANECREYR
jgi:threonyl-tRNA synthetase